MIAWTEGYVADIPYALGFYRETVPAHIAFSALAVGKHPGLSLQPKRILELGIGMGLGFVINAASNPNTQFEGVDFNPLHIAHSQGLVVGAGLTNVSLREASFQDLAREAQEGQHDTDIIVLHGILTWVSADAQEAIVEVARKRLKPGGILYVSYNCMPGWAPVLPLQRLMRENAKRVAGRSDVQTGSGIELVQALITEGAQYFAATPSLAVRVEGMLKHERNYLAHEYLNANWFIFHFADVATMFGRAKLEFIGSATIIENMDVFAIPQGLRPRIAAENDPIFRETLRDIAINKQFRRDLFARGISATTPPEQMALISKMSFALAVPRPKATLKIPSPLGELDCNVDVYGAVLDCLVDGPTEFERIVSLSSFQRPGGIGAALQAVSLLVHSGQILPAPLLIAQDRGPSQRLNCVIAEKMGQGRTYSFLAAPVVGSGVPATNIELLLLAGILAAPTLEVDALADDLIARMEAIGLSWVDEGKTITDPAEGRSRARRDADLFLTEKLPLWRQLGVL